MAAVDVAVGDANAPTYLGGRQLTGGGTTWEQFNFGAWARSVIVSNTHASGDLAVTTSASILDGATYSATYPRDFVVIKAGTSRAIPLTSGQARSQTGHRYICMYSATAGLTADLQVQEIA